MHNTTAMPIARESHFQFHAPMSLYVYTFHISTRLSIQMTMIIIIIILITKPAPYYAAASAVHRDATRANGEAVSELREPYRSSIMGLFRMQPVHPFN